MNKQKGFGTLFGWLFFMLLLFVAIYLFSQYKYNIKKDIYNVSKKEDVSASDNVLSGYYAYIDRLYIKDGKSYKCHSFVVLDGDEYFIKDLKKNVNFGEDLNFIDKNKNLVISLPWNNLDGEQKSYIASSNPYSLINIKLIQKEHGEDNPPCYSEFEIANIKK